MSVKKINQPAVNGLLSTIVFLFYLFHSITAVNAQPIAPPTQAALDAMASNFIMAVKEDAIKISFQNKLVYRDTAIIIHPGAAIDPRAYALIARKLAATGRRVFIMKTPSELIVAGAATSQVAALIENHQNITNWVLAGHSVGGVAAALYIYQNPDQQAIKGLAMWASFANPQWPISNRTDLKVVSLYGSNDCLVTPEVIEQTRFSLPQNTVFHEISGANHAQFGDYGPQERDCAADISSLRQKIYIKRLMVDKLLSDL